MMSFLLMRLLPVLAPRSREADHRRDMRLPPRRAGAARINRAGSAFSLEPLESRRLLSDVPLTAVTEFPIPTAPTPGVIHPGLTAGPDGNLWFTEPVARKIGRITPAGQVIEFSDGITRLPWDITAGPDGNLWFTERFGAVGRISPRGGPATEFTAGITPGEAPTGITAGPDGNLWFAETDAIGRITPQGQVTEFRNGLSPGGSPVRITSGPDGNLWFTDQENAIGRITPAGKITEFPLDPSNVGLFPDSITAGPDGNLWFTEKGLNVIGRITPDGAVTVFDTGLSPGAVPEGITAAPDGNLWFTEQHASRIGQITTGGVITEFAAGITPLSQPDQIAVGPDGNLWFTEDRGNQIGRLATPAILRVNDGSAQRSQVTSLTVKFNAPVTLQSGAITLAQRSGPAGAAGGDVPVTVSNPGGDGTTNIVTFTGAAGASGAALDHGSLSDGVYDLTVHAAQVSPAPGSNAGLTAILPADATATFHRLFGDTDGNGTVNALDFARFKESFGAAVGNPAYNPALDFDGNGAINALDYAQFKKRFGASVSF